MDGATSDAIDRGELEYDSTRFVERNMPGNHDFEPLALSEEGW